MLACQLVLDLPFTEAYEAADFLPAPSNRPAFDAVMAWPQWPSPVLFLHGPEGAGKSHLLSLWRTRSGALPLEAAQLVVLDDLIGHVAGTRQVALEHADQIGEEEKLFHLHNHVVGSGGSLLLTSRRSLQAWQPRLPDLRSRLLAAWSVEIAAPDDDLLRTLLMKQFADRQLRVDRQVVHYLLQRMERSFPAARHLVDALDRASLGARRPITIGLAREVLLWLEARSVRNEDVDHGGS